MSTNCCTYGCTQGQDCPARATPATMLTSCDDLGLCQHPVAECRGACEHPVLNGESWHTITPAAHSWDQLLHQMSVMAVYGASSGIAIGFVMWLWERLA